MDQLPPDNLDAVALLRLRLGSVVADMPDEAILTGYAGMPTLLFIDRSVGYIFRMTGLLPPRWG